MLTGSFSQREVPVFGFVDDFLVFGVIDEVERRDVIPDLTSPVKTPVKKSSKKPPKSSGKKKGKGKGKATEQEEEASQSKLDSFFKKPLQSITIDSSSDVEIVTGTKEEKEENNQVEANSKEPIISIASKLRWGYIISDTKTR